MGRWGCRKEGWGGGGGASRWGWGHLPHISCPALSVSPGGPQAEHSPGQGMRLTQGRRLQGFVGQVREMRQGVGTKEDILLCSSNFLRKALASRSCGAPGMGSQVPGRAPWGRGSVGVELRGSRDPVDGVPWGGASRTGFQLAGLQRGRGSTGAGDRTRLAGLRRYRPAHTLLCSSLYLLPNIYQYSLFY